MSTSNPGQQCMWCTTSDPCTHGQQAALSAAAPWAVLANQAIIVLAKGGNTFTSEDVITMVGLPTGGNGVNKNNAVGALFAAAAKAGVITQVGFTKSKRRVSHKRVISVWRGN